MALLQTGAYDPARYLTNMSGVQQGASALMKMSDKISQLPQQKELAATRPSRIQATTEKNLLEAEQAKADRGLVSLKAGAEKAQTELQGMQAEAGKEILPGQTEATKKQNEYNTEKFSRGVEEMWEGFENPGKLRGYITDWSRLLKEDLVLKGDSGEDATRKADQFMNRYMTLADERFIANTDRKKMIQDMIKDYSSLMGVADPEKLKELELLAEKILTEKARQKKLGAEAGAAGAKVGQEDLKIAADASKKLADSSARLSETKRRIQELENKDTLDEMEQKELEQLQLTASQLEIDIDQLRDVSGVAVEKATGTTTTKTAKSEQFNRGVPAKMSAIRAKTDAQGNTTVQEKTITVTEGGKNIQVNEAQFREKMKGKKTPDEIEELVKKLF